MKANFFGQLDCINLFKVLHFYSTLYRDLDIQSTHTHSHILVQSLALPEYNVSEYYRVHCE